MKKKYFTIASILLILIAACLTGACSVAPNYAKPTKPLQQVGSEKYTVLYYADEGGSIEGKWAQSVESGKDCSTIKAVAKSGYVFIGWSDGVETATRTDTNITQNLTVTAMFEYYVATVELKYYADDAALKRNKIRSGFCILQNPLCSFLRRASISSAYGIYKK